MCEGPSGKLGFPGLALPPGVFHSLVCQLVSMLTLLWTGTWDRTWRGWGGVKIGQSPFFPDRKERQMQDELLFQTSSVEMFLCGLKTDGCPSVVGSP